MAYFSNGTEGDIWENDYCRVCIHRPNDWRTSGAGGKDFCPVMALHSGWNYEQELNDQEKQKTDPKFIALEMLIPHSTWKDKEGNEHPCAGECSFFIDEQKMIEEMKRKQVWAPK